MGFIDSFFKNKKEITKLHIQQFISQKIEESSNLDYKDIQAYQNFEKLSTHISSFANSEGGLLILGISQDEIKLDNKKKVKIYPKEITWGNPSLDKERLENKLLTLIKPPINGLAIKPVRNERNEVIFLIDIPKSQDAPHMAFDYRYYTRENFRKRFMEHFEVANLFRSNWIIKEKIVEKIYEPLSSVVGNHLEKLKNFSCVSPYEVTDVLKNTYYKTQIPQELLDLLNSYIEQVEGFSRQEYFIRKIPANVFRTRVIEYLKKFSPNSSDWSLHSEPKLDAISKTGETTDLHRQKKFSLLLNNQNIEFLLEKDYWTHDYGEISIKYLTETCKLGLAEFNEHIWNKCSNDISLDPKIVQFKKSAKLLLEKAEEILEKITG